MFGLKKLLGIRLSDEVVVEVRRKGKPIIGSAGYTLLPGIIGAISWYAREYPKDQVVIYTRLLPNNFYEVAKEE